MVDIGQNQLKGTAFRSEHEVDVLYVPIERIAQLFFAEHQQTNHSHSKREQNQAKGGLKFFQSQVSPCHVDPTHET